MHGAARSHGDVFGPGGSPFHIPIENSVTLSAAKIKEVCDFIMDDDHVQKHVCGSHDLVLSTGEKIPIPGAGHKFLRTQLAPS